MNVPGHDILTCERCQLDFALWGETMFDIRTGSHIDVQHIVRATGPNNPKLAEMIKRRFDSGHLRTQ